MEYASLLIVFVIAASIAFAFLALKMMLGPRNPTRVKSEPFECGMEPVTLPRGRFSVKFYLTAMLFVVFDVELVFLFPWAVTFKALGPAAFVEMVFFLGVVLVGLAYAWRKGALEWD